MKTKTNVKAGRAGADKEKYLVVVLKEVFIASAS